MKRHNYSRRRHWLWGGAIIVAMIVGWKQYNSFNPQKIIDNSELNGRVFTADVKEITAPDSQIKAYFMAEKSNPIVSINFIFADSGKAYDPLGQKGLASLTATMMTEGTDKLTASQFVEELENYAISIEYNAQRDDFSGAMTTIKANLPRATDLLRQTLFEPRLDNEDMQRIKKVFANILQHQQENPSKLLALEAGKVIFGNHPYGENPLGNGEDIKRLTADDIRRFISHNLIRDRLYIGIAGDLSETEAEQLIDSLFADLPATGNKSKLNAPEVDYTNRLVKVGDRSWPQIVTAVFAPAVPRLNRDFYPLYVANCIFGGLGLNSRINQATREKEGLTYGAYTDMNLLRQSPQLVGNFSTTPDNFERMKSIFLAEWQKMGQDGVTANELKAAKSYLQNSYYLRFADIGTLSAILASMQREELGIDFLAKRNEYIAEISLEQVNQAARKYFSISKLIMVNLEQSNRKGTENE